ncbi:MAG: transglycosylase SLT domain-containing protein [Deltaproteobacteria bacterium]|nr:transglycosylase SLT domain-containing protein [Deltaproteobacteria bacterium]
MAARRTVSCGLAGKLGLAGLVVGAVGCLRPGAVDGGAARAADECAPALEVASREILACQDWALELSARATDSEFLAGQASLRVREVRALPPAYDLARFLRRNPEAEKYFPYLLDAIAKYARIWPVDPMFALAVLKQESDFGRHVVSPAGALGDAQFIATTARAYGLKVVEPPAWQAGRSAFRLAAEKRRLARLARDRFLEEVRDARAKGSRGDGARAAAPLASTVQSSADLVRYAALMDEVDELNLRGRQAMAAYVADINQALRHARELASEVRARQQREDALLKISALRPRRTADEEETDVRLAVNDYLAQVDPRLSPMLFVDAMVHHLADLFQEFNGDPRLVAARYNASRDAMQDAVEDLGGVGIPLIYETQQYVNRVVALQVYFALDAGVVGDTLQLSCCSSYAAR